MPDLVFCFTGAGGKTSLIHAMAEFFLARGQNVCISTTTKIFPPQRGCLLVRNKEAPDVFIRQAKDCPEKMRVLAAGYAEGKLLGFSVEEMDDLIRALPDCIWLIEADGAAGKPFKAHALFEPCIPSLCNHCVGVLGAEVFFLPFSAVCHRAELGKFLLEEQGFCVDAEKALLPEAVAWLLARPQGNKGLFKAMPEGATRSIFLNKIDRIPKDFSPHILPAFALAMESLLPGCRLFVGSLWEKIFFPFPSDGRMPMYGKG